MVINNHIIYYAQKLLYKTFPNIKGWQSTLCSFRKSLFKRLPSGARFIQICLQKGDHWVKISNLQDLANEAHLSIYDSLQSLSVEYKLMWRGLFARTNMDRLYFNIRNIDSQTNTVDCGIYTGLCSPVSGDNPSCCAWEHAKMWLHLKPYLDKGVTTPIPTRGERLVRLKRWVMKCSVEQIYCTCRMPNDKYKPMI